MENVAIILAGGSGTRFGNEKKQFFKFHGKMLYEIVLESVMKVLDRKNIVVVGVDVPGGETRSQSVKNGLNYFTDNYDRVIILEAARPLVTEEQIKQLLNNKSRSVSFVMPCVNTPIFRSGKYIDRNQLYDLLVPQAFNFELLKKAYCTNKYYDYTDDTKIMYDEYGIIPELIETTQNLYKVTYKRDIAVLESICELMKGEKSKWKY